MVVIKNKCEEAATDESSQTFFFSKNELSSFLRLLTDPVSPSPLKGYFLPLSCNSIPINYSLLDTSVTMESQQVLMKE